MKLFVKVERLKESFDYKYEKNENYFKNNIKNNSLDTLKILTYSGQTLFECPTQTVANHPHFDYYDTITKGEFQIKCFVEMRKYHGSGIHGIINATDIEGQTIDGYSMQVENGYQKGRWLIHDKWSWDKNRDLNNGYSGGCFVLASEDLEVINQIFRDNDIKTNDIINGVLIEI